MNMKKLAVRLALVAAIFFIAGCSRGNLTGPTESITAVAKWPTSATEVDSLYATGFDLDRPLHNGKYGNYDLEITNNGQRIVLSYRDEVIFSDSTSGGYYFQWMADSSKDLVVAQFGYYDGRNMGSPQKSSIFIAGKVIAGAYPGWARINQEFPQLLLVTQTGGPLAKGVAAKPAYSAVNARTGEVRNYD